MNRKSISVKGKKFVDLQGRHVILHGINMVCKEKERKHVGNYTADDFANLKKWGFNVIRLGIFWDSIEPSPGQYDDEYLAELDKIIELAEKNDIYVYLDMHQDLFSDKYADGAPDWATLVDESEHVQTDLWSESYLLSPAVQIAFDHFWNNKEAADGIGIQDHYIAMWKHIAARYKDNVTVIGYDTMNEPFMGSSVNDLLPVILTAIGEAAFKEERVDIEKVQALWLDPAQKISLLSFMSDKELFTRIMRAAQEIPQQFEKTFLNDFYNKVGRAIREEDDQGIIFLETNYFSNSGMKSCIKPITDENAVIDKNQAFSPHGYDLLVDTEMYHQVSNSRIDVIFETHKEVQSKLDLPMLVGEWGCYPNTTKDQLPQAAYLIKIFENQLASDTYFDFSHIYNNLITEVIVRAYPMRAAGDILSYHYDYISRAFSCKIKEEKDSGDNSIIYVPDLDKIGEISVEPYGAGYTVEKISDSTSGYIFIPTEGNATERVIKF